LAISQLHGILTQNRRIQELDQLNKLYESTSTTFLLDYSEDMSDASSTNDENCSDLLDLGSTNINESLANKEHPVKD
ncbi:9793_t:CDS:2, partial [Racocetra fulgida]